MKTKIRQRFLSLVLMLCMAFSMIPSTAFAASTCPHGHESCGYQAAVEGQPCAVKTAHIHDTACGYAEAKEAVPESPCTHVHDNNCGYAAAIPEVAGVSCTAAEASAHLHDDTCGYVEAKETVPESTCTHTHDDDCGYVAAVPAVEGATCIFEHTHDGTCGYVEAKEAMPCTVECETCSPTQEPLPTPQTMALEANGINVLLSSNLQDYLDGNISYSVVRDGVTVELGNEAKVFPGENFTIALKFIIPNNVTFSAGDICSIAFSSGFSFDANGVYLPMSGDLNDLAEYSVTNPGSISLRFKKASDGVSNITGSILLTSTVQEYSEMSNVITTTIGTLQGLNVNITEDTSSGCKNASIQKSQTEYDPSTRQVTWRAEAASTDGQPLDGLRFVDTVGENHTFVSMQYRKNDQAAWSVVVPTASDGGKTLTYEFPKDSGTTASFQIRTKLDIEFIKKENDKKLIKNTAALYRYNARQETPAWSEIAKSEASYSFRFFADSKAKTKIESTPEGLVRISYQLMVNKNYLHQAAGLKISDNFYMDGNSKIAGIKIENVKVTSGKNQLTIDNDYTVAFTNINESPFTVTINNDTSEQIIVSYDSLFTPEIIKTLDSSGVGRYLVKNALVVNGQTTAIASNEIDLNTLDIGSSPKVSKRIQAIVLSETEADQRIRWESVINSSCKEVKDEAIITDAMATYYVKAKLDASSVLVYTKKQDDADWTAQGKLSDWQAATEVSFTNNTVIGGGINQYSNLFSFKLSATALSKTQVKLVYDTPFIIIPTDNPVSHAVDNRIALKIGTETIEAKKRATIGIAQVADIKKAGTFDPVKQHFNWTITLTHNSSNNDFSVISISLYNTMIEDVLPTGHELVPGSVTMTKDGAAFRYTQENNAGNPIFKLGTLMPKAQRQGETTYVLAFATKITDDKWVTTTATNTARATLVSNTEPESKGNVVALEASATVDVNKNVDLTKKTNYSYGETISWVVDISPRPQAALTGETVTLTDTLPPQLEFSGLTSLRDTTTNQEVSLPSYVYDAQSNKVVFTLPQGIDRTHSYQMIFTTKVLTDQELISNSISLEMANIPLRINPI